MAGPLVGTVVVSLALNLPGPLVARRLAGLGADVTKVEPPAGDPVAQALPSLYAALTTGQRVCPLDLKDAADRDRLDRLLDGADLLLTSSRPSALGRLGLDPESVATRWPRLCQVAIVGQCDAPERAGHDLTYQAGAGTLPASGMPTVLLADQAGAERAVASALLALLVRSRTGAGSHHQVGLADVTHELAEPLRHGATGPEGPLGGGHPTYRLYDTADGAVALAVLEPHFLARLVELLGVPPTAEALAAVLATRTATEWERWAIEHGLPLAAVRRR